MLDKLKDIVPEVDDNKANLIYQKSKKRKRIFNLNINFNLALKYAVFFVMLVPVIVIISLQFSDKIFSDQNVPEPPEMEPNGSGEFFEPEEPKEETNRTEDFIITSNYIDGVLYLYMNTDHEICYLKECEDYEISSVVVNNEEVELYNSGYCVITFYTVQIKFKNNIQNEVVIYISTDSIIFEPITIKIK